MKSLPETILHQALVQIAAAVLAAWLIGQVPEVRRYVRDQWARP